MLHAILIYILFHFYITLVVAVRQHWRSLRDDSTRKATSKFEEHRQKVKRNNRLRRVSIKNIHACQLFFFLKNDKFHYNAKVRCLQQLLYFIYGTHDRLNLIICCLLHILTKRTTKFRFPSFQEKF